MEENEIVMENDVILPDSDIKFDEGDAQPEAEPTAVKEEPSKAAEVDYSKLEIPIKFLKEEKKVPFEEAQKLIQIGMNEDRKSAQLQAQLDALKGKAELIANLAQLNNLSEDDLIKNLNAEIENTKLQNIKNGKEIPDEIAKELLESRKFREEIQNKESERIAKENESKELTDFIATFPTVKADEIPTEVWDIQKTVHRLNTLIRDTC